MIDENDDEFTSITSSNKAKFLVLVDELIDAKVFFNFSTGYGDNAENDDEKQFMAVIQIMGIKDTAIVHEIVTKLGIKSTFNPTGWWLYV